MGKGKKKQETLPCLHELRVILALGVSNSFQVTSWLLHSISAIYHFFPSALLRMLLFGRLQRGVMKL